MTIVHVVRRRTQRPATPSYGEAMNTLTVVQNPAATTTSATLACAARRRLPLGAAPAATSHRELRDRLLLCNG